jgi:cytochrome c peroxidase
MKQLKMRRKGLLGIPVIIICFFLAPHAWPTLTPPPSPAELEEGAGIIKSKQWAIVLGKALFWDQQVGSDGMSCASCHYHAGADARIRNAWTPGFLVEPDENTKFGAVDNFDGEPLPGAPVGQTGSGGYPDASYELKPADFPTYHLENYKDRNSAIKIATNDTVSSSGSYDSAFGRVRFLRFRDACSEPDGKIFHAGMYPARQVEPRNTPTTINAVFNLFNFWDGRANRLFNGVGVFGPRDIAGDPSKRLILLNSQGKPVPSYLQLENSSLASQAVGPPLSEREMSCEGRDFQDVGRKMILRIPLALQKIDAQDSVFGKNGPFGDLRNVSGNGLKLQYLYSELIKKAFHEKWWNAPGFHRIDQNGNLVKANILNGYTQMAHNFSMFWGISIMLYEATLVSDRSPFDDCNPGPNNAPVCRGTPTLTASELNGFRLFNAFANTPHPVTGAPRPGPACNACHVIPLTSEAQFQAGTTLVRVERSRIDTRGPGTPTNIEGAVHDRGFFNVGVSPASFDPGNGGVDIYDNPLSIARMFIAERLSLPAVDPSGITDPCKTPTLIEPGGTPLYPGCTSVGGVLGGTVDPGFNWTQERELVDGGFKTPTLRNVALTPPYFHNGAYSTLRQVVEFYDRGGSRRDKSLVDPGYTGDTSGTGPLGKNSFPVPGPDIGTNVDRFVQPLNLTDQEIDDLTAFMLTFTDQRVQCDQAPFDHPSLKISVGQRAADTNRDGKADDIIFELPAVGAGGYAPASGFCIPNKGDLFTPGMQARAGGLRVPMP